MKKPEPPSEIRCPLCGRRINPGDYLKPIEGGSELAHERCDAAWVKKGRQSTAPTYREVYRR